MPPQPQPKKAPAAGDEKAAPPTNPVDLLGASRDAGDGNDETADASHDAGNDGNRFAVGDFVTRTYWDPLTGAGGADVVQTGVVVAIVDYGDDPAYRGPGGEQRPNGYRVAWLAGATDPLDADDLDPLSTGPTPSR